MSSWCCVLAARVAAAGESLALAAHLDGRTGDEYGRGRPAGTLGLSASFAGGGRGSVSWRALGEHGGRQLRYSLQTRAPVHASRGERRRGKQEQKPYGILDRRRVQAPEAGPGWRVAFLLQVRVPGRLRRAFGRAVIGRGPSSSNLAPTNSVNQTIIGISPDSRLPHRYPEFKIDQDCARKHASHFSRLPGLSLLSRDGFLVKPDSAATRNASRSVKMKECAGNPVRCQSLVQLLPPSETHRKLSWEFCRLGSNTP
ncbi:hypothetical protein K402DRAFT_400046 [Aulographum hederae CBS 113979]|uniref:Uncharacterized protein n=1 Tax=Aulographum hederae CBS 113979 TaxID=1176131 RepID=A0A6G1HGH1_9PEZI|nr:hypothetical protein K402DRAFT_400046 [Aulographum hederae CBS 113979]